MSGAILALVVWLVVRDLARHPLRRPWWTRCLRHGPQGWRCHRFRGHPGPHNGNGARWRDGWKGWGGANWRDGFWCNYSDPEAFPYGPPGGAQDDGGRG